MKLFTRKQPKLRRCIWNLCLIPTERTVWYSTEPDQATLNTLVTQVFSGPLSPKLWLSITDMHTVNATWHLQQITRVNTATRSEPSPFQTFELFSLRLRGAYWETDCEAELCPFWSYVNTSPAETETQDCSSCDQYFIDSLAERCFLSPVAATDRSVRCHVFPSPRTRSQSDLNVYWCTGELRKRRRYTNKSAETFIELAVARYRSFSVRAFILGRVVVDPEGFGTGEPAAMACEAPNRL